MVWYRRAAEQGDAETQNNLGALYAAGQGVERSDAEAVWWYRAAAEQDNLEAASNLAMMYLQGAWSSARPGPGVRTVSKSREPRLRSCAEQSGADVCQWPDVRPREIPRHRDLAVRGAPIACELNCIVSILLLPEIMQLPEDFL